MPRQRRRPGKLIQKPKRKEIQVDDVQQRRATDGTFRVIATTSDQAKAWIEGEYNTFKEAKQAVDKTSNDGVSYYVHADSSRVLYSKRGVVDA